MKTIDEILHDMRIGINAMRKYNVKPRQREWWMVQLAIFADQIQEALKQSEKHGKWVFIKYDCAACSNCGKDIDTGFDTTQEALNSRGELYNYCPYCGAKMDLGSNEKEE